MGMLNFPQNTLLLLLHSTASETGSKQGYRCGINTEWEHLNSYSSMNLYSGMEKSVKAPSHHVLAFGTERI